MIKTNPILADIPTTVNRVRRIEALFMYDIADLVEEAFEQTVATWKRKPHFYKEVEVKQKAIIARVYTDNLIYLFVSRGTKPHDIPLAPKNKVLRFRSGYVAKTIPGVIKSRAGGPRGPYRFVSVKNKVIKHPGIRKPRNFPKQVKKVTARYIRLKFGKLGAKLKTELT